MTRDSHAAGNDRGICNAAVTRECPMCGGKIENLDDHWPRQWKTCRGYQGFRGPDVDLAARRPESSAALSRECASCGGDAGDNWSSEQASRVERDALRIVWLEQQLRERDERLHRIHMFIDGLELRGIMNVAIEDVKDGMRDA